MKTTRDSLRDSLKNAPIIFGISVLLFGATVTVKNANAVAMMKLTDGNGNTVTVSDNGVGDTHALLGAIVVNQALGNWDINVDTGLTKPAIGNADNPHLDLGFINVSNMGAAGNPETLKIELTDVDFLDLSGSGVQGLLLNWGGTTQGTVSANLWADAGNNAFGMVTLLGSAGAFGPGAFATSDALSFATAGTPYSLTIELNLSHDGSQGTTTSGNLELTAVPEPAILALMGLGLAGIGYQRRRKVSF